MKKSLTKGDILRDPGDIAAVFRSPDLYRTRGLHLRVASGTSDTTRVLFATTRRFANAVSRNRAKRQVREAYRLEKRSVCPGFDIALILYPGTFSFVDRKHQVHQLLGVAGLLKQ